MRIIKDQLARLSAAEIRLAVATARRRPVRSDAHIVSGFDLWFPKDDRQRVLWPSTVRLSLDYFESLQRHAVPLDERAVAALSHSAMGARYLRMAGAAPAPRRPGQARLHPVDGAQGPVRLALWPDGQVQGRSSARPSTWC